jgi:hypothetical protein
MKISRLHLLAAIAPLAATLFLVPAQIHADTYAIFNLGTDNGSNIVGIDTSGQVVIFDSFNYFTYNHGVLVNTPLRQWNTVQYTGGFLSNSRQ